MKVNPIIPIWLMTIICIALLILVIFNKKIKQENNKQSSKNKNSHFINICVKTAIIILLFITNLRIMLPNGETTTVTSDVSVLFVIDTSVSMRALDYNGNEERFKGVINDCCYIVDELSSCKFSIITFGDTAQKLIPFTNDTDLVQAELKSINLENDFYANGTSINLVKETLEKTLKKEKENGNSKIVLFFITDGEITKEGETLESFSNIKQYISNGAIMGYGTTTGGKMVNSTYEDMPTSPYYYIYYCDDDYNYVIAISKIDESNLKQLSTDIGIEYIKMDKTTNINYKLNNINQLIKESMSSEEKTEIYTDIYYIFTIPLGILLIIDFAIKKNKII